MIITKMIIVTTIRKIYDDVDINHSNDANDNDNKKM